MDTHDYLRADFDPKSRSVKISDLQNIFIDHGVRYNKAKTKADYIALYEQHIRPLAPRLLAQAEKVRASSAGIEDRRLPSSTESERPKGRKPLFPPKGRSALPSSKSSSRLSAEPAENGSSLKNSRKAASMHNLAATASSGNSSKAASSRASLGRQPSIEPPRRLTRRSASVEIIQDTDDELGMDVDEEQEDHHTSRLASRGGSSRKVSQLASVRAAAPTVIDEDDDEEEDELMDDDDDEEQEVAPQQLPVPAIRKSASASPVRQPVVEITVPHRRKSEIESPHKRKVPDSDVKNEAASGFSDFNPFQSSPDEEAKSKRRRKSSMGVKREESAEPSAIKRSKTLSDLMPRDSPQGTPISQSRKHASTSQAAPPMPSEGLERFKKRISSTPDNLPSPLRKHLSPPRDSESKSRPSFASLAMAPEDFEVTAYTSPRKTEPRSRSPDKPKEAVKQPLHVPVPVDEPAVPEYVDEEPIYQSQADDAPDSDDEQPVVVASSSTQVQQRRSPLREQKKPSHKKGPAPTSTRDLVPASEKAVAKASKDVARKTLQASGVATALLLLGLIWQSAVVWADGKRALGFCNTGEDYNDAVVRRQDQSAIVRTRDLELQNWQDYVDRARDFVAPLTCTPCPEQGVCSYGQLVACTQGYIEQPNQLAAMIFGQQYALDTSKSVLPLVLSPRCVPDTAYLHRVLEIAAASSAYLRHVKGETLCSGHPSRRIREAKKLEILGPKEAYVYGKPEQHLKESVQRHLQVDASERDFERKFTEALDYLANHKEIVRATYDNTHWIAATAADMPLGCRARLAAYSVADEHKGLLSLITAILAMLGYGQRSIKHRREIAEEVEELVPLSLSLLQAQDQNYNLRDSMTPVPYLAPAQLRDLVLRDEKSSSRKAELWKKVEKAVESNANVRARMAEQHGEEIRVWQWVGGAYETDLPTIEAPVVANGAPASTNRRRSYAALAPRSSLSRPGTPRVSMGGDRHISWDEDVASPATESKPYA